MNTYINLAVKYHIDYINSAHIKNTRINKIIEKFEKNYGISVYDQHFLEVIGLNSLKRHMNGEISFDEYIKLSINQKEGYFKIKKEKQNVKDEKLFIIQKIHEEAQERYIKEFQKREKLRKEKTKLFVLFNLYDVKTEHHIRLNSILNLLNKNQKIKDVDVKYLKTNKYFNECVKNKYYFNKGIFFEKKFKISKNPWFIINSCSNFRKANRLDLASVVLSKINWSDQWKNNLKSAYLTVRGAIKRENNDLSSALSDALYAHKCQPKNHRPCTLLGALYIQTGSYKLGEDWFSKAIFLGASKYEINKERSKLIKYNKKAI